MFSYIYLQPVPILTFSWLVLVTLVIVNSNIFNEQLTLLVKQQFHSQISWVQWWNNRKEWPVKMSTVLVYKLFFSLSHCSLKHLFLRNYWKGLTKKTFLRHELGQLDVCSTQILACFSVVLYKRHFFFGLFFWGTFRFHWKDNFAKVCCKIQLLLIW